MNPSRLSLWVLTLTGLALAGPCFAQYPYGGPYAGGGPYTGPKVSPYLNLLRPGSPTSINYYGLVRPEFEFRGSINALRNQTLANQQAIGGLEAGAGVLTTGHPVGFMTHLGYFQNLGGVGGGTAYTTAAGTQARPANAATAPTTSGRGGSRTGR